MIDIFNKRKINHAFTLAEVLITLGIIGVVAAMTLPAVINKYQKIVTANKLKKFYTVMSQAIISAEKDNGELQYWMPSVSRDSEYFELWYSKYLEKYIKTVSKERLNATHFQVGLADGSGFVAYVNGTVVHFFYCTELRYCGVERYDGQTSFLFSLTTGDKEKFTTGYKNLTREQLLARCKFGNSDNPNVSIKNKRHTCSRLIQYDGWDIKPDYTWKQTILEPQ